MSDVTPERVERGDEFHLPDEPQPGLYRHKKTNSLYIILGTATCSTNGSRENRERSVIYFSLRRFRLRYRELFEFTDGRFEQEEDV